MIRSAARSASIYAGPCGWQLGMNGSTDKSTMRRPTAPFTVRSELTTPLEGLLDVAVIDAVEVGWNTVEVCRRACAASCASVVPFSVPNVPVM